MKLCSKCKKRPAVVFVSDMSNPNAEPNGLCLVCAKELGIKPVEDMLKKMNISDEDIEQMSDQFMDIMALNEENDDIDDADLNDETFDLGTAPAMPSMSVFNKIFGDLTGGKTQGEDNKETDDKKADKKEKSKKYRVSLILKLFVWIWMLIIRCLMILKIGKLNTKEV